MYILPRRGGKINPFSSTLLNHYKTDQQEKNSLVTHAVCIYMGEIQ